MVSYDNGSLEADNSADLAPRSAGLEISWP